MRPKLKFSTVENHLLQKLSRLIGGPPIRLTLLSGAEIAPRDSAPAGTVIFRDRQTLAKVVLSPEIEFGDAYTEGRL
jgi:hypothetical protein